MADFANRTRYLENQVGSGSIVAGCTVNQAYAQNQHETVTFHHDVGRHHYLGGPLLESVHDIMMGLARSAITESGSKIKGEMQDVAEQMSDMVLEHAPRDPDIGDVLANSGSPYVKERGLITYSRPPVAPRRIGPDDSNWDENP